jgi:hypothetical protein
MKALGTLHYQKTQTHLVHKQINMKHLLLLTLLIACLIPNLAFAINLPTKDQTDPATRRQQINQCKDSNKCSLLDTREERRTCNNQCENQYPATETEPTNKEVLPPIIKPSLLPGPSFGDANNRTGQEVTGYVTEKLLPKVASRLLTIMSVASLLGLMYAGVQFYMALGDPEKMGQAKRAAIFSVVGLILALLSFSIVQIINLLPL